MNFIDQLRTLDPRDVGRWPLAVRGFFVLLIFIVCSAFAWYMFVWNDDRPVLQKAEADELDLRSQFENKQQRAANLDAYKAQLGEMERSSAPCCGSCPARPRCRICWWTFRKRAWVRAFRRSCSSPRASKAGAFTPSCRSAFRLVGKYHEFGTFVSGIAALPRIVTLHDIQISPMNDKAGGYDNLIMDVTAKTYRYIEDDGGHAGPKKKSGGAT